MAEAEVAIGSLVLLRHSSSCLTSTRPVEGAIGPQGAAVKATQKQTHSQIQAPKRGGAGPVTVGRARYVCAAGVLPDWSTIQGFILLCLHGAGLGTCHHAPPPM